MLVLIINNNLFLYMQTKSLYFQKNELRGLIKKANVHSNKNASVIFLVPTRYCIYGKRGVDF